MRAAWLGGNGRHVGAQNAKAQRTSTMATADSTGGLSTSARAQQGLQRISEANIKHGRQTKDNLNAGLLRVLGPVDIQDSHWV